MEVKEYDGARSVQVDAVGDFVILDTGDHAYTFDRGIVLHAMKRILGIALIIETAIT